MRALSMLALVALSGCMQVIAHDEDAAAKKALEFAKVSFIAHNAEAAYPMLAEETRRGLPVEKYAEVSMRMHPSGYPTTVTATEYEPIPGQRSLSIILVGQNGDQKFFYRLVMLGTADTGYTVGGFFRSNVPYPGNSAIHGAKMLQPLKTPYTAAAFVGSNGNSGA